MNAPENLPIDNDVSMEDWAGQDDGELGIDVCEDQANLYVIAAIAGVKPSDVQIAVNNDLLTIRGKRNEIAHIKAENYFYQECYWGSFSRSIILPTEVKTDQVAATLEQGILTITLPKLERKRSVPITVK